MLQWRKAGLLGGCVSAAPWSSFAVDSGVFSHWCCENASDRDAGGGILVCI